MITGSRTNVALLSALLLPVALTGCATVWAGLGRQGPPADTPSAQRLARGPHDVGRHDFRFVDPSRVTPPNGDYPGAPSRTLETTLWVPEQATAPCPS